MPKLKRFGRKIETQFNNTPLIVEQNNYATKAVNGYIVYISDTWRRNLLDNFVLKNYLLNETDTTNIAPKVSMCVNLWNNI